MTLGGAGRWRDSVALFLVLWLFFWATSSREWAHGQAAADVAVAAALVKHGTVATEASWPASERARDGRHYPGGLLLPALVHLPAEWLRTRGTPPTSVLNALRALAGNLPGSAFGALACVLLFRLARRMGARRGWALGGALALGLGTHLWAFARTPSSEPLQAAVFLGFFGALVLLDQAPARRAALVFGAWAALLVNANPLFALALPGAVLLLWRARRWLGWAALTFVPLLAPLACYDWFRFGGVLRTGVALGPLGVPVWHGLWALFGSPSKSVLLYAPPLLLSLAVARPFGRRWPRVALGLAATVLPVLALLFKMPSWPGAWSWGPRVFLFAVPVLLLPAVVCGPLLWQGWQRRTAAGAVLGFALGVQTLGVCLSWDHADAIGQRVQFAWLGKPTEGYSITGGLYENHFSLNSMWPLDPIGMNLWFARHLLRHHTWSQAILDAPWRAYTTLTPGGLEASWKLVKWDWWFPDSRASSPGAATAVLVVLALALAGALVALVRSLGQREDDLLADT
jgi:hypothetical protein